MDAGGLLLRGPRDVHVRAPIPRQNRHDHELSGYVRAHDGPAPPTLHLSCQSNTAALRRRAPPSLSSTRHFSTPEGLAGHGVHAGGADITAALARTAAPWRLQYRGTPLTQPLARCLPLQDYVAENPAHALRMQFQVSSDRALGYVAAVCSTDAELAPPDVTWPMRMIYDMVSADGCRLPSVRGQNSTDHQSGGGSLSVTLPSRPPCFYECGL